MNLAQHVLTAAETVPDETALSVVGLSDADHWSFSRLSQAVRGTATGLQRAGLRLGDRLLMRLGNRSSFPIAYLRAIAAGIVAVPTSVQLSGPEITRMAAQISPAMVVAGPEIALADHPAPVLSEAQLTAMAELPPADFVQGDPDRLAYIIFSSASPAP